MLTRPSRAEAYRFKGEWDSAIDDYSEAIQLEPAIGKNYFHRGNCYFKKGDLEKALRDYNEAIVNDPCLAEAYYERGNLRRRMGDLEVAIADYDEAVLLNPTVAEIYYNRGKAYQLKGDLKQAINDYNESIRLKPKIPDIYGSRADAYVKGKGRIWEKAIDDYESAIRLGAKLFPPYNNYAWLLATSPDPSIQNGKRAVELALKACELTQWKRWNCLGTLGAAYARTGDFAQAIKYQTEAMSMEGVTEENRAEAQQRLILYQQGKAYGLKAAS